MRSFFQKNRWKLLKIGGAVIGVLVVISAGTIGALAWKSQQVLVLPAPSGPFAIGRVAYDWIDQQRNESFFERPGEKRELLVWVWYPAEKKLNAQKASYLPDKWAKLWNEQHGEFPFRLLTQQAESIQVHASENVAVSSEQESYPVVIFEPGLGAIVANYTTIIEDLVSHGYIVVGITPTYSASQVVFPDGRVIEADNSKNLETASPAEVQQMLDQLIMIWTKDVIFSMNQLEQINADKQSLLNGKMDLTHLGVFGHSLGGAAAAEVCHLDARCKAGINLDGTLYGDVLQKGLKVPFLFVNHDEPDCSDAACKADVQGRKNILGQMSTGTGYDLTIAGTKHQNFADYAVMFTPLRLLGVLGPIDGERGLRITSAYVSAFFDKYLKGKTAILLDKSGSSYQEVRLTRY